MATWDLIGINTTKNVTTAPATTKDAGLTVSNLTVASTMIATAIANGSVSGISQDPVYLGADGGFQAGSLDAAITQGTYLQFTITPASGKRFP